MTKGIITMKDVTKLPEQIFHKSNYICIVHYFSSVSPVTRIWSVFSKKILEMNRQETEPYMKNYFNN